MANNHLCFFFNMNPNFQHDLSLICSFIFSHPLYFSYILFFSPYLIRFVFFISPLFLTTTLLLLLSFLASTFPPPKLGLLRTVLDKLRSKLNGVDEDEEFCDFEDFEIYKIVFHDPSLIMVDDRPEEMPVTENAEKGDKSEEEKRLERLFEELDKFEDSTPAIETKEEKTRSDLDDLVAESQKPEPVSSEKVSVGSTAEEMKSGENQTPVENSVTVKSNSWRLDSSNSFCSYGSMRKEKEWKRTLACKLFEERHNSEGGEEGMDSLWEVYETDNSSIKSKNRKDSMINQKKPVIKNKNKNKNTNLNEFKYFKHEEDEDEDDDDEFMSNGQLCCLKALKLSAGKMNLGMGKPNLVKISKALKGFGWLHHVSSKHGKKN